MKTTQILTAGFASCIIPFASADDLIDKRVITDQAVPPPGPVQHGALVHGCGGWVLATPGMTCYSLAHSVGVEIAEIDRINPQLRGHCSDNLWAGYSYCIGLPLVQDPFTPVPPPDHCKDAVHDQYASAVLTASDTPAPMVNWCNRYLSGPECHEKRPEGIFSSYDGFPKQAMASSLCAYPSAPPAAPRFSLACECFTEMHSPKPTS
ncbi:hypothetical protein F5X98DRAFT_371547 [Xylaria grammica]|nr:hypothetical protein F5X98DRAFT_371547 [Xylaria grammica]